jgi:hypothetical protein
MIRFALLSLVLTATAHADGAATDAVAPVAQPEAPKRSSHVGITLGGAAIPGTDLSVAVAQLNLILAVNEIEMRVSPVGYRATGETTSHGLGAMFELRRRMRERFAISAGSIVSLHMIEGEDPTLASGVVASPAIFLLGDTRQYELGLSVFLVYELEFKTVTPGAWVSLGYRFN